MKRIDAHIHFRPGPGEDYFDRIAREAGHEHTEAHLREAFEALDIERAVVMGNRDLALERHRYPDILRYCAGLDRDALRPEQIGRTTELIEQHLKLDACVGLKVYAGYTPRDLTDPIYAPFYEMAARYDKPVAVHTGATASSGALLRYSHPLQLDEAAVANPQVRFVMCHFGNPFLMDAAAVLEKNPNVVADLSGLLVGRIDLPGYLAAQGGYVQQLKTWIAYVEDYDKFLYGTDWPLAGMQGYIRLTEHLIPEVHWEKVFYQNAKRVYGL